MCVKSLLSLLNLGPEMEYYLSSVSSAIAVDSVPSPAADSPSLLSLRPAACCTGPDSA